MAVSHLSIDPDTVDALIDVLTRLKRNEGSQDEKYTFMNIQACYENEMDLSAIRTALSKATRMRDALQVLALHAEREVQEMKYKFPMAGIRGLPNELLSRIFELVCEQFDSRCSRATNGTCAIRLSQVCTHFRSIALNTPRLWASVSYDMMQYNGKLEAFLTRSKNAPLTIEISWVSYRYDDTLIEFLSAIKLHAHRWKKLNVFAADSYNYFAVRQAFGSEPLDCPILESIDVRCPEAQIDEGDNTFCLHWNIPALWRLSSTNWYPTPFPNSHLTSLEYVWLPGLEIREYVPEKLQMFINATHSLREFKLVIYDLRIKGTRIPPYLPAHFPQLIKLSLLFQLVYREQIVDVMRTLRLPNLEELSIELSPAKAQVSKIDRYIKAFLPSHDKFPHLKDFQLSVQGESGFRYLLDMAKLFSLLPTLHNLTLELPNARLYFGDRVRGNASTHAGPALRSLRLIKCHSLTDDFIEDALPMIRGGTGEDAFSLLEIRDCEKLSHSRVEAMLRPKEKLLWS